MPRHQSFAVFTHLPKHVLLPVPNHSGLLVTYKPLYPSALSTESAVSTSSQLGSSQGCYWASPRFWCRFHRFDGATCHWNWGSGRHQRSGWTVARSTIMHECITAMNNHVNLKLAFQQIKVPSTIHCHTSGQGDETNSWHGTPNHYTQMIFLGSSYLAPRGLCTCLLCLAMYF